MTVQGIRLTLRLKKTLPDNYGWLTDQQIDAAHHLILDFKAGVGGLNSTVIMNHLIFDTKPYTNVLIATVTFIHNVTLFWVVDLTLL